jgi:hypothetical protein
MRNNKISLQTKQAAYNDYKRGVKVVEIINKHKICWGTLYSYIHKQEQMKKTLKKQSGGGTSTSNSNSSNSETIETVSIDNALLELENL